MFYIRFKLILMQFKSKDLPPQVQLIGWFRHLVSLPCDNHEEPESIPFVDNDSMIQNNNSNSSQNKIANANHYARNVPNLHNVDQVEIQQDMQTIISNHQELKQPENDSNTQSTTEINSPFVDNKMEQLSNNLQVYQMHEKSDFCEDNNQQSEIDNNTRMEESEMSILDNEQNFSSREIFSYKNAYFYFSLYPDLFYNCNSLNNSPTISFYTNIISENRKVVINNELFANSNWDREDLIVHTFNNPENSIYACNFPPGFDSRYSEKGITNEIIYNDELKTENFESYSSFSSKIVLTKSHIHHSINKSVFENKKDINMIFQLIPIIIMILVIMNLSQSMIPTIMTYLVEIIILKFPLLSK